MEMNLWNMKTTWRVFQILHGNFWSVSLGNKVKNKPLTHFHITGLDKLLVAVIILIKNLVFSAFFAGRNEKSKQNGPSGKSDAIEHFAVHNCVFTNRLYIYLVNADSKGEPNIISYFGYSSIE